MLVDHRLCGADAHVARARRFDAATITTSAGGARQDVWAAVDFLEERRPGRPVIVSGNSMGSAAAVFAAKRAGPSGARLHPGEPVSGPQSRGMESAGYRITAGPEPCRLMPGCGPSDRCSFRIIEQISPLEAVKEIPEDVPVLILAGDADRLARLHEAQAILAEVASHGKLVLFPGPGTATCSVRTGIFTSGRCWNSVAR